MKPSVMGVLTDYLFVLFCSSISMISSGIGTPINNSPSSFFSGTCLSSWKCPKLPQRLGILLAEELAIHKPSQKLAAREEVVAPSALLDLRRHHLLDKALCIIALRGRPLVFLRVQAREIRCYACNELRHDPWTAWPL